LDGSSDKKIEITEKKKDGNKKTEVSHFGRRHKGLRVKKENQKVRERHS